MADHSSVGADLRAKLSKADSKVRRLEISLATARDERDELAVAMRVLTKHGYIEAQPEPILAASVFAGINETQALVLDAVPKGEAHAVAPKDVTAILHARGRDDITADYIRTTLWRLAKREMLQTYKSLYWRSASAEAENEAAPDEISPEAAFGAGPLGGERGYPPSAPEGSIPSGSTPRPAPYDADLDDDVPF